MVGSPIAGCWTRSDNGPTPSHKKSFHNLPAKSKSTAETLLRTAYQDNLFKVMNPDQTMETNAPSILDELIRPLTEPAVQPVPEGFKSYVTTFIPKSQLDEMFTAVQSGLYPE